MKVGDLVQFVAHGVENGDIGLILEDDTLDNDGLYRVYFPGNRVGYWFDDQDVKVISPAG